MYSAPYGFPNAAAGPIFNGAPPQQGAHLQPGPSPNQPQQQQQQQQPQQMMYNSQQFPMPGQPGVFPAGGPNPALMGGGGGPAGMMQNAGMPHMAANGQMSFQTPFTSSSYASGIPSSTATLPQLPANFMMAGQMNPYQMNTGLPSQQPMMQRMLPAQQNPAGASVSTPQRQFNNSQGTPTNSMPPQQQSQHHQPQQHQQQSQHQHQQQQQQQHFSTPRTQGTPQSQTPTTAQHPPASIATPQTPTFPSDQGQQPQVNGTSGSAPQSPATESRDKERMAVLLEINQELLYESIQLVNSRNELKKEQAAVNSGNAKNGDIDYAEEEKLANLDYNQCMRRLQANLTYMYSLADPKAKAHVMASPAYLTPPPLNMQLKLKLPPTPADDPVERPADPVADRIERDTLLKNLYKKLHSLYPGIDPRKEPPPQPAGARPPAINTNAAAGAGAGGMRPGPPSAGQNGQVSTPVAAVGLGGGIQGSNQGSPAPTLSMGETVAPGLL